jgi:hypothetical protein
MTMKKLLFIIVAVIAVSCGEGSKNQSVNSDQNTEDNSGTVATPADSTGMAQPDSMSTGTTNDSIR